MSNHKEEKTQPEREVKIQILNQLIRDQIALRYSLEVQHNAYGNLKSERAAQILKNIESQLVEASQVVDGFQKQLDELISETCDSKQSL